MAEVGASSAFTYASREPSLSRDSRLTGLLVRYSGDSSEVKVEFLFLNMGQQRQKQAAKTAARSNLC